MRFMVKDGRLAFPNVWSPYKGSFGARIILPPTHKQVVLIRKAMMQVANEKWESKGPTYYKALEKTDKLCLHDGDTKAEYEGFEGNLFIAANSKVRPSVFDQMRNDLTQADGKPYSGCYVNASIEIWAQDNAEYGKRINAQLRGIQFLRDGEAFAGGGQPAGADEFDEIGVEGEPEEEDLEA